jgi:hypothetical protein
MLDFSFTDGSVYSGDETDFVDPTGGHLCERIIYYLPTGEMLHTYMYCWVTRKFAESLPELNQSFIARKELYDKIYAPTSTIADRVIGLGRVFWGYGSYPFEGGVYIPISVRYSPPDTYPAYNFSLILDLENYYGKIHYDPARVSVNFRKNINLKDQC